MNSPSFFYSIRSKILAILRGKGKYQKRVCWLRGNGSPDDSDTLLLGKRAKIRQAQRTHDEPHDGHKLSRFDRPHAHDDGE